MKVIKQYFKLLSYGMIGLTFAFSSFYLFANLYHYSEIRREFEIDFEKTSSIVLLNEKIDKIINNISKYNGSKYNGSLPSSEAYSLNQKFNNCVKSFRNDTYMELKDKNSVNIKDVYSLLQSLNNDVLNQCVVTQLYPLTLDNSSEFFDGNEKFVKSYFDTLLQEGSYLEKDILNNSSYYFNTDIISLTVKNNTRDGFEEVMSSYNKIADMLLALSEKYANDVKKVSSTEREVILDD